MTWLVKYRTIILLALAGLALGIYVYVFEIKGTEEKKQAEEEARKIFSLTYDDVGKIRVQYEGDDYTIARQGEGWFFSAPFKTIAQAGEVKLLLDRLFELKRVLEIGKETESLKDFGLSPAKITVSLWSNDGKPVNTIWFGDRNPAHDNVYVMTQKDSSVLLVTSGVLYNVQKKMFDLRDRDLCSFERDRISRIELKKGKRVISLEKKKDNNWYLASPVRARAQRPAVNKVLDRLVYNKAEEFVAEEAKNIREYGLDRSWFAVTAYGKTGQKNVLLIGNKVKAGDFFFAKRQDRTAVFTITGYCVENLDQSLAALRDTVLIDFISQDIASVRVTGKGGELTISKGADDAWQAKGKSGEEFNRRAEELVKAVKGLKWVSIRSDAPRNAALFGLQRPSRQVTVKLSNGLEHVLELGKPADKDGKGFYCRLGNTKPVYIIGQEVAVKADQILN